jgi:hypothetical protein
VGHLFLECVAVVLTSRERADLCGDRLERVPGQAVVGLTDAGEERVAHIAPSTSDADESYGFAMGYRIAADAEGLDALRRLRRVLAGQDSPPWEDAAVVAVLLHDPTVHVEIDEWMSWRFDRLDRASGKDLHFFALRSSSREARSRTGPSSRRATIERWLGGDPGNGDWTRTALAHGWSLVLSHLFSVGIDSLPGLVVFSPNRDRPDLASGPATYVPLQAATASATFNGILELSHQLRDGLVSPDDFHLELPGWSLDPKLSDPDTRLVLEGMNQRDDVRPPLALRPPMGLRTGTADLYAGLRLMMEHRPADLQEGANGLEVLKSWHHHADGETQLVFATAHTLWKLGTATEYSVEYDWGCVVAQVAKGFERSVAMSLVHAARRAHGIELPQWYGLHKPGFDVVVGKVDLNRAVGAARRTASSFGIPWKSPSIGEALAVYSWCVEQGHIPPLLARDQNSRMKQLWNEIAAARNPLAHQFVGRADEVRAVAAVLRELAALDVPRRLAEVRRALERESVRRHDRGTTRSCRWKAVVEAHASSVARPPSESSIQWEWQEVSTGPALLRVFPDRGDELALEPVAMSGPSQGELERAAIALIGLGLDADLHRMLDLRHERESMVRDLREASERLLRDQRRVRKEILAREERDVIAALLAACATGEGLSAILETHAVWLATVHDLAVRRCCRAIETGLAACERTLQANVPEVEWIVSHRAVLKHGAQAGYEDEVASLMRESESGARSPEDALATALSLLSEEERAFVNIDTRKLRGALRYWADSVRRLLDRDGGLVRSPPPYFLALCLLDTQGVRGAWLEVDSHALESDGTTALEPDRLAAIESLDREVSTLRLSLSRRLAARITGGPT